ncbi:MAG: hypothetical protein GY719_31480 [bacterium]|nr:hypothetical protein [bacterium]
MPLDFTVVQAVRQRFGDSIADEFEFDRETEAPFVGAAKDFPFECPNIDRSQDAILQFQSLGVSHRNSVLQVNSTKVFGGLSTSVDFARDDIKVFVVQRWATHHLLLQPGLLRNNNVLRIESRRHATGGSSGIDNFVIDNITVLFKTRRGGLFEWLLRR